MAATWLNGLKRVHIESPVSAVLMELNGMPTRGRSRKIISFLEYEFVFIVLDVLLAILLPVSLRWQLETWIREEMVCFDTIMLIYNKSNRGNEQSFLTMGWDVLHPLAHLPQAPTSSPTATPPSCRPCACLSVYRSHQ